MVHYGIYRAVSSWVIMVYIVRLVHGSLWFETVGKI